MIQVKAVQDDSGHWYIIPNELLNDFDRLLDTEEYEEFNDSFSKYMTGGDLNLVQLYAEI